MKIVHTIAEIREIVRQARLMGHTVGFVPFHGLPA